MAVVKITINGVICDLYGRTITGPVKIVGEAMYTDLGVGGGPIFPPEGGGGDKPDEPPKWEIWPSPGRPAHPIVLPPDKPVDPPTEPPTNPADPTWVWGWNRAQGWHPVYVPPPGASGPH